jgi:transcription initiation factor TFIIE subunit alpha
VQKWFQPKNLKLFSLLKNFHRGLAVFQASLKEGLQMSVDAADPGQMPKQSHLLYETIIQDYRTIIGDEFDENFVAVLEQLSTDFETTEEKIGAETNMPFKEIRKILYKLYDSRIATYRMVRDPNTGYIIFLWKLLPLKCSFATFRHKAMLAIKSLEERIEYEKNNTFYHCGLKTCQRLTFDQAMEAEFKCPTCTKPLQPVNNEETINMLRNKILELQKDIETISRRLSENETTIS